jgi:ribosomal protein S18 acetylase RimI-like enzyme
VFTHRPLGESDAEEICTFPRSRDELFYLFPNASYPLTPEQLLSAARSRPCPTVVLADQRIVAYGNFIQAVQDDFCSIGNVIANPLYRRRGAATYLIKHMADVALGEFRAGYVRISCFNHNSAGLLLYHKLGFKPVEMEVRRDPKGEPVVLIHMNLDLSRHKPLPRKLDTDGSDGD